jgi:hypothetical protein
MTNVSFEQLCAFIAIRGTQDADESLRHLILHLIALFPSREFRTASDVKDEIAASLGVDLSEARVQHAIDGCLGRSQLRRTREGRLVLGTKEETEIQRRIEEASALEARVRDAWLREVAAVAPEITAEVAWAVLHDYLTQLFRQHGLHTMALIDPTIEAPPELETSQRTLILRAVEAHASKEHKALLFSLIELFFQGIGANPDKIAFIVHLADSVVSYYALVVDPDIATRLRAELKPLTLFVDTNVLFGLIGLDDGPQVDISHELVDVVEQHKLPLRLRYHAETEIELRNTFDAATSRLMGMRWSPQISRAASKARNVSTIQRLYHERNAARPLTAETFFEPYRHLDVLIQEKGIKIYRESDAGRTEVFDMIADYEQFLSGYNRVKSYEARNHDMTLLHSVRRLRSKAESSLQAEALLVTYDYLLHRFDWVSAKRRGDLPCTVLPNQLLQLLRPFLPVTTDFDRSFAETFAIPEMRAMGGKAHLAVARLLQIMASYEGVSEQTASAILANDVVLDGLQRAKSDDQLREYVESAIAAENAALAKERDRLTAALEEERARGQNAAQEAEVRVRHEVESNTVSLKNNLRTAEQTAASLSGALAEEQAKIAQLKDELAKERQARKAAVADARYASSSIERLEARLQQLESAKATAQARSELTTRILLGVVAAAAVIALSEALLKLGGWPWLSQHAESYGLRGAAYMALMGTALAVADRTRRGYWFAAMAIGAALIILQLLGGPLSAGS